jgi:hypothetical protein
MRSVIFLAALALAGCATGPELPPEPVVRIVEVKVPVTEPCNALEDIGDEPSYPDTPDAVASAPTLFERVKLLLMGRAVRDARLQQYTAAKRSC